MRVNVYVTAGNDTREVSIGGMRGQQNNGYSNINFDYFKEHTEQVRDKRYKKEEVMRDIQVRDFSDTSHIYTSVQRCDDGSVSCNVSATSSKEVPKEVLAYNLSICGAGLSIDAYKMHKIVHVLSKSKMYGTICFAVYSMLLYSQMEFTDENIREVYEFLTPNREGRVNDIREEKI